MSIIYKGQIKVKKPEKFIEEYLESIFNQRKKDVSDKIKNSQIEDNNKEKYTEIIENNKFQKDESHNSCKFSLVYFYNPKPDIETTTKQKIFTVVVNANKNKKQNELWDIKIEFKDLDNEKELNELIELDGAEDLCIFSGEENSLLSFFRENGVEFKIEEKSTQK